MQPDYSMRLDKTHASASIQASGKVQKRGKAIERLAIGSDDRFWIAAQKIPKNTFSFKNIKLFFLKNRYVELKNDTGDRIFLNINSLAKRCHLQPDEIKKAVQEDQKSQKSEQLLQLIRASAEELPKVLDHYKKIFRHFEVKNDPEIHLQIRGEKDLPRLKPETLIKTIRVAMKQVVENGAVPIFINPKLCYIIKYSPSEDCLNLIFKKRNIGRGAYGSVDQVINISTNNKQQHALKIAIPDDSSVWNEYNLLKRLQGEEGIQEAPHMFLNIAKDQNTFPGFLGVLYDSDYQKHCETKIPFRERVLEFYQLINGLCVMDRKNILHGDLKPANILVKKDQNGMTQAHIADFGGARDVSKNLEIITGVHTHEYSLQSDMDRIIEISKECKVLADSIDEIKQMTQSQLTDEDVLSLKEKESSLQEKVTEYISLQKKREVLSMGLIFYEVLKNLPLYPKNENRYLIKRNLNNLKIDNVPQKMVDLIKEMTKSDLKKRLTAEECLKKLEIIIEESKINN